METPTDQSIEREIEKMNTDFTASSFTKRRYPVIDPEPDINKIFDNMKRADFAHMASFLPGFVTMGYCLAGPKPARKVKGIVIGAVAGVFSAYEYAYLASFSRLTGSMENADEVARYNKK